MNKPPGGKASWRAWMSTKSPLRGLGADVYDRLRERGYGSRITAVNGGAKASNGNRFVNKRAEMWGLMKDWFEEDTPVQIPEPAQP